MLYDPNWKQPEVVPKADWQQLMVKAIDVIKKRGWIQQTCMNEHGVCMFGALVVAEYGNYTPMLMVSSQVLGDYPKSVRDAAEKLHRRIGYPLWNWNDEHGRTKEEVISMMEEVANAV